MRKLIVVVLMGCSIGAAFRLYQLKFETRRVQVRVQQLEMLIEGAENDIAVLRAEWNFLTRPERVERLAKKQLQLQPSQADQFRRMSDLDTIDTASPTSRRQ